MLITHKFYDTKNIDGFTYDMEEQVLQVTFKSGIKYNYYKVQLFLMMNTFLIKDNF